MRDVFIEIYKILHGLKDFNEETFLKGTATGTLIGCHLKLQFLLHHFFYQVIQRTSVQSSVRKL